MLIQKPSQMLFCIKKEIVKRCEIGSSKEKCIEVYSLLVTTPTAA